MLYYIQNICDPSCLHETQGYVSLNGEDVGIFFHISDFDLSDELSETINSEDVLSQKPIAEEMLFLDASILLLVGMQILKL